MKDTWPLLSELEMKLILTENSKVTVKLIITSENLFLSAYMLDEWPMALKMNTVFYPTIFTLWRAPGIISYVTTWPAVFERIRNGSDLMISAILTKCHGSENPYGNIHVGQTLAINTFINKAAFAVGMALLSSDEMYKAKTDKVAIRVINFYGDYLCRSKKERVKMPEWGHPPELLGMNIPSTPPPPPKESRDKDPEEEIEQMLRDLRVEADRRKTLEDKTREHAMDDLLKYCLLMALKTTASEIEMPIKANHFYEEHMIPAVPEGRTIDLKESSYKCLTKFFNVMHENQLVSAVTHEQEETIIHINRSHPFLQYELIAIDVPQEPIELDYRRPGPVFEKLKQVTPAVLAILSPGHKEGDNITIAQLEDAVKDYVRRNRLNDPVLKNLVKLDFELHKFVDDRFVRSIPYCDLIEHILLKMDNSYRMTVTGDYPLSLIHNQYLEPISIEVTEMKMSNIVFPVTRITNLELYGIDFDDFASECNESGNTKMRISQIEGKRTKELLVEGNKVLLMHMILTGKYRVPMENICGLLYAPVPKKKSSKTSIRQKKRAQ